MTELLDMAHEMGKDLFKAGAMDLITKRQLDTLCLPKVREYGSCRRTTPIKSLQPIEIILDDGEFSSKQK